MNKTASPTPAFVVAQALSPKAELITWLGQQAATTLLRVPVELDVSALGVSGASLGEWIRRSQLTTMRWLQR